MRFVLASHNKGKLAEMQAILGELGVEVVMPSDVGVTSTWRRRGPPSRRTRR